MRHSHVLIAVLAGCALAFATPVSAGTGVALSNEHTVTQWAHPKSRAPVRLSPDAGSHAFTHLHAHTEDGLPEVYEALRQQTDASAAS